MTETSVDIRSRAYSRHTFSGGVENQICSPLRPLKPTDHTNRYHTAHGYHIFRKSDLLGNFQTDVWDFASEPASSFSLSVVVNEMKVTTTA